jgi:hypothetical protein
VNRSSRRLVVMLPLVDVEFTSHSSTGTDDQTRPGMGIRAFINSKFNVGIQRANDTVEVPLGVIPRDHLQRLITFMQEFLDETYS